MSAVMSGQEINGAQQAEVSGRAVPEGSTVGRVPIEGASPTPSSTPADHDMDALRAARERRARTPIVPLAWLRGVTQVDPEEAGERRAGRPKMNVRRCLTVGDLDSSLTYLQRRTRDVQRLVQDAQPDSEQTTRVVKAAIKDAIRRLSQNLPAESRDAIDSVVAGI
jgi:hypothetical protein